MNNFETYAPAVDVYAQTSKLDPLYLDDFFQTLPDVNLRSDADTIAAEVERTLPFANAILESDTPGALAGLRDLDFLLSSGLRHGRNFISEVDGLEDTLVRLGAIAGTVPRGTVATYGLVNPSDERQRSFTGTDTEAVFIEAVTVGARALEDALNEYTSKGKINGLQAIDQGLDVMIDSIITVKRQVSPEFFTNEMRPYFDPIEIKGKKYLGAGGAQLQFVAIDFMLWGADDGHEMYRDYFAENAEYLSPEQRHHLSLAIESNSNESLLTYLQNTHDPELAIACLAVLKKLKKFRLPHRRVAEENFKLRNTGQVGSGSYTTNILDVLIDKTLAAIDTLEEAYESKN
jgi:hypothetical protein